MNLYAYVGNNPVSRVDPHGLTLQEVELAIKMAAPLISFAIDKTFPSAFGYMGIAGDFVQFGSGASVVFITEVIAVGSTSCHPAVFFIMAFAGGAEVGSALNRSAESAIGRPLGVNFYNWLNPSTNDMITKSSLPSQGIDS